MSTFFTEAFIANEDLSTHQYKIMVNSTGDLVGRAATAGESAIGILDNKPESGQDATINTAGVSRCIAGGTIVAGNEITTTASATGTVATSGTYILGKAITGVASGNTFKMTITNAGYKS
jgi:hypothetical protein